MDDGADMVVLSIGVALLVLVVVLLSFLLLIAKNNRQVERLAKFGQRNLARPRTRTTTTTTILYDKEITSEINNNNNNNSNNNNNITTTSNNSNNNTTTASGKATSTLETIASVPNKLNTTKRFTRGSMTFRPTEIRLPCIRTSGEEFNNIGNTEIPTNKFVERLKVLRDDAFDSIIREFEVLNRYFPTERKSFEQSVDNMKKNRFMDVLPYDDNRVRIKNHHTDYINASFIDGYNMVRHYIATQGPIGHNETSQGKRESTVEDFWIMLCEQDVQCIVMLTECVENLRLKCAQYWPEEVGAECNYGKVNVRLIGSFECDEICTLREMSVTYEGHRRIVKQWHYKEWQDCKGPQDARHLIDFIRRVRQSTPQRPILVHCSAGVGRTGVFIALDILLEHILHHSSVDIFECVKKLREQRVRMVQTIEQYITLYDTVAIAIQESESSSSPLSPEATLETMNEYVTNGSTFTQIAINA